MKLENRDKQKMFRDTQLFALTLQGVAQRGYLYADDGASSAKLRESFRLSLKLTLENLADSYGNPVDDATHVANIEKLSRDISLAHRNILNGKRFRIGSAQKALNLYLKYRWCFGEIPVPPHCPFDAEIIRKLPKLPGCTDVKWTQLDCIEKYKHLVACARDEAKQSRLSIAEWELGVYNDQIAKRQAKILPMNISAPTVVAG